MRKIAVNLDEFKLSCQSPRGKEYLKISGGYPDIDFSRFIFSQIGLLHLVAPYLPRIIKTNFAFSPETKVLAEALYESEKRKIPDFYGPLRYPNFSFSPSDKQKVVVAFSGGKDSLWNMQWAIDKYGPENVLAVHINGLNKSVATKENEYAHKQKDRFGFKNFRVINLQNGTRGVGFETLRMREIFLAAIIVPWALEFGAPKIIIEALDDSESWLPFSEQAKNMRLFNKALSSWNVPVRVSWLNNGGDSAVMRDLFENHPEWPSLVSNCFTKPSLRPRLHLSWHKRAQTFPLYESQCGSCMKCRLTNVARVLYDPVMASGLKSGTIRKEDIKLFLTTTADWILEHLDWETDLDWEGFIRDWRKAAKKFGTTEFTDIGYISLR